MPVNLYLTDHKTATLKEVTGAVKLFREQNLLDGVNIRLASGNAGVQMLTNEVLETRELPMMVIRLRHDSRACYLALIGIGEP